MFRKVSHISVLLAVATCAATAIHITRIGSFQAQCSTGIRFGDVCCAASCGSCGGSGCGGRPGGAAKCCSGTITKAARACSGPTDDGCIVAEATPDKSNQVCNSGYGQRHGPFTCSDGAACMNAVFMIRQVCKSCCKKGFMTTDEEAQCQIIAQGEELVKGVKIECSEEMHRHGCASPALASDGWVNWAHYGAEKICPCVRKFVDGCKDQDLHCVLNKVDSCPKVCPGFKARIKEAQGNSLMEDNKDEHELKDRARVLVDAHGKTSRNASASIMSLDHSMNGKCSQ